MPDSGTTARLAAFLLATALPYVLASFATPDDGALQGDRRRFEVAVIGTSALYIALHAVAFTVGLSLGAVFAVIGGGAVLFAAACAVTGGGAASPAPAQRPSWLSAAATVIVVAVGASWLAGATMSMDVAGTDAAHYHVPHAVNYALGATPWDPLPTRHAYPMGTSLLFAWFILPFGDAFIADAAMVVHAFLLLVSLAALFRAITGLAGWVWSPWLVLTLLTLPLFAAAGLPSADLPYTAAFMALAAQLLWMLTERRSGPRDWLVLGAALGLLLASKVTGALSAAALVLPALVIVGVRVFRAREPWPRWRSRTVVASAAALLLGCLPGALWFLRNQWVYGQLVDSFPDRYYLSIAGDLRTTYKGEWGYLFWRLSRRMTQWLGPWFLASGYAVTALFLESVARRALRRGDLLDSTRLWFVGISAAVTVAHVAALIGAPWTSLEWTGGSSLRYILPIWATWAFLAYAAFFSRWLPWHANAAGRAAGWLALGGAATWMAAGRGYDPWWAGFVTAPAAVAGLTAVGLAAAWTAAWRPRLAPRVRAVVVLVLAVLAPAGLASWLAARHEPLRRDAETAEQREVTQWVANRSGNAEPHRQVYLDVRGDEARRGQSCDTRRFFVASRFDLPLDLQPAAYSSLVFDSRDAGRAMKMIRGRPDGTTCDYVVVLKEETSREVVRAAAGWLREIDTAGTYLAFRVQRPPSSPR